ncbi:MAG: hypothetical protein J5758_04800 [Abditibacteriota bacterium]|nr:hypothetical protein [Abditibacteriota bacterium]
MKTVVKVLLAILCLLAVLLAAGALWLRVMHRTQAVSAAHGVKIPVVRDPGIAEADMERMNKQCAEEAVENNYAKYLPDVRVAEMQIFDVEKTGTEAAAYVILAAEEFVSFGGKAYSMSGVSGEAIVRYTLPDKKLTEIEWSEDGAGHEKWVRKHFTKKALAERDVWVKGEGGGRTRLGQKLDQKAEKLLGVPVEQENLLMIDLDKGTYEIIETIESGDTPETYKFDTKVLDKGTLTKKD